MERIAGAVKVDQRVEITDEKSARAWLETQDHQTQVWFASRCALRVLPGLGTWEGATSRGLAFASLRAMLISTAAATCPAAEMKGLKDTARSAALSAALSARSADSAARSAARSALSAAHSADSARSADSAALSAALSARSADSAASFDANAPKTWHKLWSDVSQPEGLTAAWAALQAQWTADDADWSFWIEWYEGILNGTPMDWDLIFKIATELTEDDWNAGQSRVAERIKKIQASFLGKRAPLAEKLEVNPDTGLFRAVPLPIENAALITTLVARAQDALEDALHGNNGLTEQSNETRILTRTFARYANDPQRVEMDFTSMAVDLRRQMYKTHELPDNAAMIALLSTVEEGARGLRATYPEVATNRAILAQAVFRELPATDKEFLENAQPKLIAMSEDIVAEDFATDIPALINDALLPLPTGAPRLPGADPATRIFNRVSKMHLVLEEMKSKGASAFDSDANKTVQFLAQYGGYSYLLAEIVKIGLRALGVI